MANSDVRISVSWLGGNFELFAWCFMRLSGVLLLLLVLGHVAVQHVFGNVEQLSASFVAQRLAHPFWRTYDLTLLFLALLHGVNGARQVLDDYLHSRRARLAAFSALCGLVLVLLTIGTITLLTATPAGLPNMEGALPMR